MLENLMSDLRKVKLTGKYLTKYPEYCVWKSMTRQIN